MAENKLEQVKGNIKETVGDAANNDNLEQEGKKDKASGKAKEVVEAMNIPQSTIARIENGDVLPHIDTMQAIANVTNKRLKIEYV